MRPAIRTMLEREAKAQDRSLSEEAGARIEQTLIGPDNLFGPELRRLASEMLISFASGLSRFDQDHRDAADLLADPNHHRNGVIALVLTLLERGPYENDAERALTIEAIKSAFLTKVVNRQAKERANG